MFRYLSKSKLFRHLWDRGNRGKKAPNLFIIGAFSFHLVAIQAVLKQEFIDLCAISVTKHLLILGFK